MDGGGSLASKQHIWRSRCGAFSCVNHPYRDPDEVGASFINHQLLVINDSSAGQTDGWSTESNVSNLLMTLRKHQIT